MENIEAEDLTEAKDLVMDLTTDLGKLNRAGVLKEKARRTSIISEMSRSLLKDSDSEIDEED